MYWATARADPEIVRALIDSGADVNVKDDKGTSALQLAKQEVLDEGLDDDHKVRVQKVIDLLIASGAKKDHP